MKVIIGLVADHFENWIDVTTFDISFNISPKSGPVIFLNNKLLSLFDSKITS